ncbi:membrane protein [Dechloromonas agitata]|uniref:membrane protein n=1 Tax=Dechloromonas agitata TaxID=73030 RepID=UPI0004ACF906|nr:membrane protein [Dechloromonas agitata]
MTRRLLLALLLALTTLTAIAETAVDLHVFWSLRCPHCLKALPELRQMAAEHPWLHLHDYEITQSPTNLQRFQDMALAHGETALAVPTLFYCGHMEVGWPDAAVQQAELLARLEACRQGTAAIPPTVETPLNLPLLGEIRLADLSLPVLTILLAGLDAFNPCAFFVLLFLLSLLTHQHQRSRMLLIGGIFVLCSGVLYFAFMAAWLNVFLVVGNLAWITAAAGALALLIGALNLKDYFAFPHGPSLSISAERRADLFQRGRRLVQSGHLPTMLATTLLLASVANFYELLCTAGFPMVFTRLLTLREQDVAQHYAYLLLYNLIYILPLLLIVLAFVRTLGSRKLSEREGRLLKLLSGLMMFGLGLLLVIAPEQLDNPQQALLLPLAAVALTALIARWTRP